MFKGILFSISSRARPFLVTLLWVCFFFFRKLVMYYGMLSKKFPTLYTLLEAQTPPNLKPLETDHFLFLWEIPKKKNILEGDFGGWFFEKTPLDSGFPWVSFVHGVPVYRSWMSWHLDLADLPKWCLWWWWVWFGLVWFLFGENPRWFQIFFIFNPIWGSVRVHLGRLTWNLLINHLERKMIWTKPPGNYVPC